MTLFDPMDCQAPLCIGFSRQECWTGLPFPSKGSLPSPGIEPGSPALQADSLPSEPLGNICFTQQRRCSFLFSFYKWTKPSTEILIGFPVVTQHVHDGAELGMGAHLWTTKVLSLSWGRCHSLNVPDLKTSVTLHSPSWSPVSMAYFIFVPFFRSNPSFPETWPLNSLLSLPTSAFSTFLVPARHNGQISSAKILLCLWHFLMQTFSLGVVVGLNQKNLMVPNAESCDCQPDVCTSDLPRVIHMHGIWMSVWGQALRLKKKKQLQTMSLSLAFTQQSPDPIRHSG